MKLTSEQELFLASKGHVLMTGGPGSGKTTVSILKAGSIAWDLAPGQSVLFMSFARATVSRVVDAIGEESALSKEVKARIEVDTYHSFFWRLIKTHGYLLGLPRKLAVLTPPAKAAALSAINDQYGKKPTGRQRNEREKALSGELERLASRGTVAFDLMPSLALRLLSRSSRIRRLVSARYPTIILDEFQDTNLTQWGIVKELGRHSTLLALADPEQRIYDFIGADPERLDHFGAAFCPTEITLGQSNHRSGGTDIARFGNALLSGNFSQETYEGVEVCQYDPYKVGAQTALVLAVYAARKRVSGNKDWSIAILVPTNRLATVLSEALRAPPGRLAASLPHGGH